MPIGAVEAYGSAPVRSISSVAPAGPVNDTQAAPPPEAAMQATEGKDTGGVLVSISPEAEALAEAEPPKERGAPQADMALSRALDGIRMEKQEPDAVEAAEPQTRTTDPMVIAQSVMAG